MAKNSIIIKKVKKVQGGGHHGGAWKVAYADFVTAMMAFFLLLWLVSVSDKATLQGVAQYFTPTESISDKAGLGFDGGTEQNVQEGIAANAASSSLIYGSPSKGHRIDSSRETSSMSETEKEHFIDIMNNLQKDNELQKFADNLHIDITNEGLRIQIMDSNNRPVFKPNTTELQPYINQLLEVLGKIISSQPNYISISGHTAAVHNKSAASKLDFWDISVGRANVIRNYLSKNLIDKKQVVKIIGKADREPFVPEDPYNVKNIRVGITLLNNSSISSFQRSAPE